MKETGVVRQGPLGSPQRWWIAGVLLIASDLGAAPLDRIVLVTPLNTVDTVISEVIVREAYGRLGIAVDIKKYPAERALRLADAGEADGEVQRIDGIAKRYTNLIQVRPAINYIEGAVFTKTVEFAVEGWESLRPYRIGIIRGIKFAERNTKEMDTRLVSDYAELFRMLDRGLFDVAISPRVNGWYQIAELRLTGIRELEPPVERFDLFHYLNRKHIDQVPEISRVFERMKEGGELADIRARVIRVMLDRARAGLPLCDDDYGCFAEGGAN